MKTPLQPELEQRIGRNLLRYQLVELRLKQALPLRRVTLSPDGLLELQKAVESLRGKTLGHLAQDLVDALEFTPEGGRDAFLTSIQRFIDDRNWLVHHLLQDSSLLQTDDAAQACIVRLDADYIAAEQVARHVLNLHRFILQSIQCFADEWVAAAPATATDMRDLSMRTALKLAELNDGMISVHLEVPILEVLSDAMGTLERTQRRSDGWVIFNAVGYTLRRDFGTAPPRLLKIAREVPGFEFENREVRPGAGPAWMFRRLQSDAP